MSMSTRSKTARLARQAEVVAQTQSRPAPPASPDVAADGSAPADKCSICLSSMVNKCKTNCCRHEFCFSCLLEWSKVKAECPLCKASVSSIIHNIRDVDGQEIHDTYTVPPIVDESTRFVQYLNYNFGSPHPLPLGLRLTPRELAQASSSANGFPSFSSHHASIDSYLHSIIHFSPAHRLVRATGASSSHSHPNRLPRELEPLLDVEDFVQGLLPEGLSINAVSSAFPPFFRPPTSRNSGNSAPRGTLDNPFINHDDDDLAGSELNHSEDMRRSASSLGYQRRKRVYDRGQYVEPFSSTLQPGAVFFPSVDYFTTHPTAFSRIQPWLKRELTVLLALTTPRSRLAALYELIVSMLQRHDIRSREFREMIRVYFDTSARVKHFQHEFYHFVLSGMPTSAYDNVAAYNGSTTERRVSGNAGIPVVTIEDDDESTNTRNEAGVSERYHEGRWRTLREVSPPLQGIDLSRGRRRSRPARDPLALSPPPRSRSNSQDGPRKIKKPRTENQTTNVNEGGDSDSDDCQLLGIHPIVKPPPLAVITIDSDGSDNEEPSASQFDCSEPSAPPQSQSTSTDAAGPSNPGGSHPNAPLYEIADSPSSSSSSVYVVQEVGHHKRECHERDQRSSSPKPSTSAAARRGIRMKTGPMKKSDYLLQRMFDDLDSNSNEQDIEVSNWMTDHQLDRETQGETSERAMLRQMLNFSPSMLHVSDLNSELPSDIDEEMERMDGETEATAASFLRDEYGAVHMKFEELEEALGQAAEDNWDYTLFAPPSRDNNDDIEESSMSSATDFDNDVEVVFNTDNIQEITPYTDNGDN